jgi:hypothetical protein
MMSSSGAYSAVCCALFFQGVSWWATTQGRRYGVQVFVFVWGVSDVILSWRVW